MCLRNSEAVIFCWLSMRWLLTVLGFALARGVDVCLVVDLNGGCCLGTGGGCIAGCVIDRWWSSITSMIVGIGVFLLVCCWWMRGVAWMVLGAVRLLSGEMLSSNLGSGGVSTLCGCASPTLGAPVFCTLCGGYAVMLARRLRMHLRWRALYCANGGGIVLSFSSRSVIA